MSCIPVSFNGVALDCGNVGGVRTLYIADVLNVDAVTASEGEITAITMKDTEKFKKFEFRKGNANFVSSGSRDDQAGTSFVETVTTASFNHMETAKRKEMQGLATANTYVIAVDENGKAWFIGYGSYNGGTVSANTGAALSDANNYEATLTSRTVELPMEVASDVLETVI